MTSPRVEKRIANMREPLRHIDERARVASGLPSDLDAIGLSFNNSKLQAEAGYHLLSRNVDLLFPLDDLRNLFKGGKNNFPYLGPTIEVTDTEHYAPASRFTTVGSVNALGDTRVVLTDKINLVHNMNLPIQMLMEKNE